MSRPSNHLTPGRGRADGSRRHCGRRVQVRKIHRAAHTGDMPVRLHHVVVDAHDLPGLAGSGRRLREWAAEQAAARGRDTTQPALYLHGTQDGCHGMTQEQVNREGLPQNPPIVNRQYE
jgi:hypothetical protein